MNLNVNKEFHWYPKPFLFGSKNFCSAVIENPLVTSEIPFFPCTSMTISDVVPELILSPVVTTIRYAYLHCAGTSAMKKTASSRNWKIFHWKKFHFLRKTKIIEINHLFNMELASSLLIEYISRKKYMNRTNITTEIINTLASVCKWK